MPGEVRLNQKEFEGLIEQIEAQEGDATELKKLRGEVAEEERVRPPARRVEAPPLARAELTTEERLNLEAGELFPGGITADILAILIEYDRKHSLADLKAMCVEAGLSPSGHKKLLAAKLIAHQLGSEAKRKAEQAALFSF